jgi:hypothetical protein
MTVSDTRAPSIPRPRAPQQDDVPAVRPVTRPAAQPPAASAPSYPWPEPWQYSRAARPRSEYWDHETASWHSRGAYPKAEQD